MIYLKRIGIAILWPFMFALPPALLIATMLPAYIISGDATAWADWAFEAAEPYVWGRR